MEDIVTLVGVFKDGHDFYPRIDEDAVAKAVRTGAEKAKLLEALKKLKGLVQGISVS